MMTTYRLGDYVCPTDLPRRFVCRVIEADTVSYNSNSESCQILKLDPQEGPWPSGMWLIRLSSWVTPASLAARRGTFGTLRPAIRLREASDAAAHVSRRRHSNGTAATRQKNSSPRRRAAG